MVAGDGCAAVQAPHTERVIDGFDGRVWGDVGAAAPRFDGVGVEFQVGGDRLIGNTCSTHHGDPFLLGYCHCRHGLAPFHPNHPDRTWAVSSVRHQRPGNRTGWNTCSPIRPREQFKPDGQELVRDDEKPRQHPGRAVTGLSRAVAACGFSSRASDSLVLAPRRRGFRGGACAHRRCRSRLG